MYVFPFTRNFFEKELPKTGHGITLSRAEENDGRLVGFLLPAALQVTRQRRRFAPDRL